MAPLEAELAAARDLSVESLADAIEAIGFECTRCGACCKGTIGDPHTATVFPDEVRALAGDETGWRDVARPIPFGLDETGAGETFEWALQIDDCGDCTFYDDGASGGPGSCTVYADRPRICETYPFSVSLGGSTPMGAVVDSVGPVQAHECEGLGREIARGEADALAERLKARTVHELEEAIAVRDRYESVDAPGAIVHDSEGQKRPDGTLAEPNEPPADADERGGG